MDPRDSLVVRLVIRPECNEPTQFVRCLNDRINLAGQQKRFEKHAKIFMLSGIYHAFSEFGGIILAPIALARLK